MSDVQFEIVSDDLRSKPRETVRSPWVLAALEGNTVRVKVTQQKMGGYYRLFENEGHKLHTKADGEFTIVWADPIVSEPAEAAVPETKKGK